MIKRILLLGEFSGFHNNLKLGLRELGADVTLAASSDAFKKFPADIKFGTSSNRFVYFAQSLLAPIANIGRLAGHDVVHAVNLYVSPRNTLLNSYLFNQLKSVSGVLSLSLAGDDPLVVRNSDFILRYSHITASEHYDRKAIHWMKAPHQYRYSQKILPLFKHKIPVMYEYYSCYAAERVAGLTAPVPLPIKCDSIRYTDNNPKGKLTVFHGLNRPGSKGTHIVREAFDTLTRRYPSDFKFIIAGGMPIKAYLEVMSAANVVVDQMYSYSLAMNALQAMAAGKVVIGGVEPESHILYGDGVNIPAINTLPSVSDLVQKIIAVLENRSSIRDYGNASRNFVKKYHDHINIARRYLDIWSN